MVEGYATCSERLIFTLPDMTTALLIIDMQADMQARLDAGRDHVNGDAATKIARLAKGFRAAGLPVVHVRHADADPASSFHPDQPGHAPMPCAEAEAGEMVFVKSTSSAFASTGLERHLRDTGVDRLFVCGAVAGFCVTSTVRSAADLGFDVTVVKDAVLGFGLPDVSAADIFTVSMALLAADFATMTDTDAVLVSLRPLA